MRRVGREGGAGGAAGTAEGVVGVEQVRPRVRVLCDPAKRRVRKLAREAECAQRGPLQQGRRAE